MMKNITEIYLNGQTLVFGTELPKLNKNSEGYIILDFNRKFEEPDLSKIPASLCFTKTPQEKYLAKKYNVILGEISEL